MWIILVFRNRPIIKTVLSEPACTKLGFYSNFRIRNAKLLEMETKNVAVYAFSLGKV